MLYAYIGTAAVIAILVGSVTLCVIWLSRKVSTGIREKTVDILSAYDILLEKRRRELAQLEESIRQKTTASQKKESIVFSLDSDSVSSSAAVDTALVNAAERLAAANYRESTVGQTYRKIRDTFQYDPRQVLAQIPEAARVARPGPASKLLEELSYNTVYRLSTLAGEDQLAILEDSLSGDTLELLKEYCGSHAQFQIIDFYDYLQAMAALEPQRPRLRVSPGYRGSVPEGMELIVDPDICEGFQIEAAGSIYDYCVKGRELS